MKWLLTIGWAVFVVGGLGMGWGSLHNLAVLTQTSTPRRPVAAAARLPLRDFDQSPPPFAAAGDPQAQPAVEASSPVGRLSVLLMGIDQRPDEATASGDPGRTDTLLLVSI